VTCVIDNVTVRRPATLSPTSRNQPFCSARPRALGTVVIPLEGTLTRTSGKYGFKLDLPVGERPQRVGTGAPRGGRPQGVVLRVPRECTDRMRLVLVDRKTLGPVQLRHLGLRTDDGERRRHAVDEVTRSLSKLVGVVALARNRDADQERIPIHTGLDAVENLPDEGAVTQERPRDVDRVPR